MPFDPAADLLPLLGDDDRFVRYSAREALERTNRNRWRAGDDPVAPVLLGAIKRLVGSLQQIFHAFVHAAKCRIAENSAGGHARYSWNSTMPTSPGGSRRSSVMNASKAAAASGFRNSTAGWLRSITSPWHG